MARKGVVCTHVGVSVADAGRQRAGAQPVAGPRRRVTRYTQPPLSYENNATLTDYGYTDFAYTVPRFYKERNFLVPIVRESRTLFSHTN